MNKKKGVKLLKYIISLGFAFGLLYLLFKNQDPAKLIEEIGRVDAKWVILSMVFGGTAIVNRGLRWIVLIDALGYKASKLNSISAVSIAYFTNLFIPRAGEISRCTSLNQVEKIPVDKLFGTILIERVIDFIFLFILIFLTLIFKFNDISKFYTALNSEQTGNIIDNNIIITLGIICIAIIVLISSKNWLKKLSFYEKILNFISGLKDGFKSIKSIKNKSIFWGHTFSVGPMERVEVSALGENGMTRDDGTTVNCHSWSVGK